MGEGFRLPSRGVYLEQYVLDYSSWSSLRDTKTDLQIESKYLFLSPINEDGISGLGTNSDEVDEQADENNPNDSSTNPSRRLLLGGLESALSVNAVSLSAVSVPSEEL
ncbi:uncharacterized protein G2W53_011877 [Senna tora]|uniref:Uncharacterized protein n=1 Tax=Senna tora TaxID=362788 RepID=A0A834U3E8_9FABA|nr:uncharacterized protein G2W53_011877 [Senna tora]